MISQKVKLKTVNAGKIKRKYPNVKNIKMSENAIFEVEEEKKEEVKPPIIQESPMKPIKEEISMMGESQMSKAITAMTAGIELSMSDGDFMDSEPEDQF